jgi:hypothetical protein
MNADQGENSIGRCDESWKHNHSNLCPAPYYPDKIGYACQLPAMLQLWRQSWAGGSNNPFGVVDLHAGSSEGQGGNGAMGNFRWAQTASYGQLPNEAMPNSFMANAYGMSYTIHSSM